MISFIIPTYKEERAIEATLKRLRDNPPPGEFEIIVSDHESPDKTVELAKKYADKIVVKPRSTIAKGRNDGAAAAKGDLLVFLDSDTEIPNSHEAFAKLISLFEKDPNLVGATIKVRIYPELMTFSLHIILAIMDFYYTLMNNILGWGSAWGKFQMVRAEAFRKIGGYDEKLVACEDQDLFRRLTKVGRTWSENSLYLLHHGRRHLQKGPWRVFFRGMFEGFSVLLFKRSIAKEWKAIR